MAKEGWVCPVCGPGVSPMEKTCDHGRWIPSWTPDLWQEAQTAPAESTDEPASHS